MLCETVTMPKNQQIFAAIIIICIKRKRFFLFGESWNRENGYK